MKTKVVHLNKNKFDVDISRPSKWGNPFKIGPDGNRTQVIEKYRKWIEGQPELLKCLDELDGKVLACWCKPQACHGDVLVELIKQYKKKIVLQEFFNEEEKI